MTVWFTSDTHFGHEGVIGYCNRPWKTVEEMNEGLIKNWNSRIKQKERVYVLGDFAFCGSTKKKEILSRLNGQKVLVKGNHDASARVMIECGFHDVIENEIIKLPSGRRVTVSHFPKYMTSANEDQRYPHKRIHNGFAHYWHLHGHVHIGWHIKPETQQINVGVDVNNWVPINDEKIEEIIKEYLLK